MKMGYEILREAFKKHWMAYDRDGKQIGWDDLKINSNSINVTLGNIFLYPAATGIVRAGGGMLHWNRLEQDKVVLSPGDFILGCTNERFDCRSVLDFAGRFRYFAPMYDGRSTMGRLGLMSHVTAGFGDYGFCGYWTLELKNVAPYSIELVAGMEIGQVSFEEVWRPKPYDGSYTTFVCEPKPPVGW